MVCKNDHPLVLVINVYFKGGSYYDGKSWH
jgi:hypothetical protein